MSVLEWIVISQVVVFVIALIISCHLLGMNPLWENIEPTEEEAIYEPLQDRSVESLDEEKS